jgi:hypothetical protein
VGWGRIFRLLEAFCNLNKLGKNTGSDSDTLNFPIKLSHLPPPPKSPNTKKKLIKLNQ